MKIHKTGKTAAHKSFVIAILLMFVVSLFPVRGMAITIKEEEELSEKIFQNIRNQLNFIDDPMINAYINQLGQKILTSFPPQHFHYQFYVINEQVYNAFATPAGHIFFNSGLIEAMDSEAEFAGILAHEIAHVHARHISQKIELSKKINILTLAGLAASIFLGSQGMGEAAQAASLGTMAAGRSAALAFSREDEIQADQLGLQYLKKAGYGGEGLMEMMKKIRLKNWYGSVIPNYLSTHPASEDRMAYIDTWIQAHEYIDIPENPHNEYAFRRMHAKLVAVYAPEDVARNKTAAAIANDPADAMANYGYGLYKLRVGSRGEAVYYLQKAFEQHPLDIYLLSDLGRAYFQNGQYEEAQNVLSSALQADPDNPDTLFYLGRTLMTIGENKAALIYLERAIDKDVHYYEALFYLGKLYGQMGQMADAHYHLGGYYVHMHKRDTALYHLKKAADMATDENKKKKIDALIDKLEGRTETE